LPLDPSELSKLAQNIAVPVGCDGDVQGIKGVGVDGVGQSRVPVAVGPVRLGLDRVVVDIGTQAPVHEPEILAVIC